MERPLGYPEGSPPASTDVDRNIRRANTSNTRDQPLTVVYERERSNTTLSYMANVCMMFKACRSANSENNWHEDCGLCW